MKKPYPHTAVSNVRCVKCHKQLKRNLIEKNIDADYCYKCYPKSKKNRTGAHKAETGKGGFTHSATATVGWRGL